ncbi:MAG: gliding motility lipoprotein GldD [Bacteroidales bacterium]
MKKLIVYVGGILFCLFCLGSCDENYIPKPMGYFRIDLPQKTYLHFNQKGYPYSFDYPSYAKIIPIQEKGQNYWIDVSYEDMNAKLHLSYESLFADTSLSTLIKGTLFYVNRHISKSSGITEVEYEDQKNKIWGCVYDIKGDEVASTYQFYLTDSVKHFVRGALYIESVPNNDSLAPVIVFLKKDIDQMVQSFRWK